MPEVRTRGAAVFRETAWWPAPNQPDRGCIAPMDLPTSVVVFQQLGISLLLGLLVGLQRQHAASGMPGMRTFPLITVFGTVSALLAVPMAGGLVLIFLWPW